MGRTRVRRRRRLVLAGMSVVIGVVLSSPVAGALGRHDGEADGRRPAARVYVVRSGDTVWSIAQHLTPGDPRALVDAIARRNGIDAGDIVPGQALVIPRVA